MSTLDLSTKKKCCSKANSQYLPDVGFSFGGCLVVLFNRLLVIFKVLEAKETETKER